MTRRMMRLAGLLVLAGVLAIEAAWLIPHVAASGREFDRLQWGWLAVALLAQVVSMVALARLQRSMLYAGGVRVPLPRTVAVTLAGNAMSVTMPGGSVLSAGYLFRWMRRWGAPAGLIVFNLAVTGGLSLVALAGISLIAPALGGAGNWHWDALIAPAVFVALTVALVQVLRRHPTTLERPATAAVRGANRILRRAPETGVDTVRELVAELAVIRPRASLWARGMWFAAVNWAADIACLIFACRAVPGGTVTVAAAVLAYLAGTAGASLPGLPGGLGVVEGALLLGLTHSGTPLTSATAAVVIYRVISFVLVVAVGWLVWWRLRKTESRRPAEDWSTRRCTVGVRRANRRDRPSTGRRCLRY